MPDLIGDTFIARMDAKADRNNKILIVHNHHFDPITLSSAMHEQFVEVLKTYVDSMGAGILSLLNITGVNYLVIREAL